MITPANPDLMLFKEQWPDGFAADRASFKSECPPDKKIKIEDLFQFKRGQGDLHVSLVALAIALFFLAFFWTQTGWNARRLPDNLGSYLAHQFGLMDLEGRMTRFGRILKQSWVVPALCLTLLVPAALWNVMGSWKVHRWRTRFMLPTSGAYEFSKYLEALEYVAYFVLYTFVVPWLGYLVSTLLLGTYLTWRLGYRSMRWLAIGIASSLAIVLLFRTALQIKTPVNIWLYDQLPDGLRALMLTYF